MFCCCYICGQNKENVWGIGNTSFFYRFCFWLHVQAEKETCLRRRLSRNPSRPAQEATISFYSFFFYEVSALLYLLYKRYCIYYINSLYRERLLRQNQTKPLARPKRQLFLESVLYHVYYHIYYINSWYFCYLYLLYNLTIYLLLNLLLNLLYKLTK